MMASKEKVNILMVDDHPGKLLSYEAVLGDLDENLIRASSAREAMEVLLREDIAVVLMDVNMPDLDGFALANMMRDHPRFRATTIIFISAVHLSDADRINAYHLGAVDYISVPVIPEILRAKVTVFVDLYRKTHLLERLNADLEIRVQERTEQLRVSEAEQRDRAEQLAQFFDATTDGILVLDRSYRIVHLNRRGRALIGRKNPVSGTYLFDMFPAAFYPGSPYVENFRRTMDLGEPTGFEAHYPEPLNIWLRIQSYPSKDGIVVFFRDFTEEKAAHEELVRRTEQAERQTAEIETLYKTAPIGLALFDAKDFRYLRLNDRQAGFFGLKPEDVIGRTLTEMAPIPGLRELFNQVLRGEPVMNYALAGTLVTDPDDYRHWTVSYFPVHGPNGDIEAITAASLEITEQKRAEQALIEAEKLAVVGRLASSIAHEINNPLEAVVNLLYLASASSDLDEVQVYLQTAQSEIRRMSAIVSQTLRFHRQATAPQAVEPAQIVESVLSLFHPKLAAAKVRVSGRTRSHALVRCFEGEIRQVISNLVGNGLDAMKNAGGRMVWRTRSGRNWATGDLGIVITIADTGTGMARQTQAKLFNPFFTTKESSGTGLGLWVSKQIVDRHGGVLRVRSSQSAAHHGTVFTLFLPFQPIFRDKDSSERP